MEKLLPSEFKFLNRYCDCTESHFEVFEKDGKAVARHMNVTFASFNKDQFNRLSKEDQFKLLNEKWNQYVEENLT